MSEENMPHFSPSQMFPEVPDCQPLPYDQQWDTSNDASIHDGSLQNKAQPTMNDPAAHPQPVDNGMDIDHSFPAVVNIHLSNNATVIPQFGNDIPDDIRKRIIDFFNDLNEPSAYHQQSTSNGFPSTTAHGHSTPIGFPSTAPHGPSTSTGFPSTAPHGPSTSTGFPSIAAHGYSTWTTQPLLMDTQLGPTQHGPSTPIGFPPTTPAAGQSASSVLPPTTVNTGQRITFKTFLKVGLSNLEELDQSNDYLGIKEHKKTLIADIHQLGGDNPGKMTRNALKKYISAGLAGQLSWAGRKKKGIGKRCFKTTKLCEIIIRAVLKAKGSATDETKLGKIIAECIKSRGSKYNTSLAAADDAAQ